MADLRWSTDCFPAQQISLIGRVVDPETGEVFVVVRHRNCEPWALRLADWLRLDRVAVCDRGGAA